MKEKRIVLITANVYPAMAISYRNSMFWAGTPIGDCDFERVYRKITGSTLLRLLRHSPELTRTQSHAYDEKTGTEFMLIEIKLKEGAK